MNRRTAIFLAIPFFLSAWPVLCAGGTDAVGALDSGGGGTTAGGYILHGSIGSPFVPGIAMAAGHVCQHGLIEVLFPLPVGYDGDGNGLPDLWEKGYFGATGVDPDDDPDHDGSPNRMEMLAMTHPLNPLSAFRPSLTRVGPDLFIGIQAEAGRNYLIWRSDNLSTWSHVDTVAGNGSEIALDLGPACGGISPCFVKIEIQIP